MALYIFIALLWNRKCCHLWEMNSAVNTAHCIFRKGEKENAVSVQQPEKNIPLISSNLKKQALGRGGSRGGGGTGKRRRSPLMSILWVFSWSRDLFVLLLFPNSSVPPPVETPARRTRLSPQRWACHGWPSGAANWIQLDWPPDPSPPPTVT